MQAQALTKALLFALVVTGTHVFAQNAAPAQEPHQAETRPETDGAVVTASPAVSAPAVPSPAASAPSVAPETMCDTLAAVAARHELPADFFIRLIWQESRFNPSAVSFKGAQGVAQFMPGTARMRGLDDPFDPVQAIPKSAELLRDLNREFGNLGLAAAAYNAGAGRVHEWLSGRRPLPGETIAYVRLVTGRSAEEWAGRQKEGESSGAVHVPCIQAGLTITDGVASVPLPPRPVPPWGAEVAGGPTQAKALARYREVQAKYPAILGAREPHLVVRGILGDMGAVRARAAAENRADADKVCAALRAAAWYCDVMHN
ncbi:MAG: lytic transglycosylase domain-containing protein [Xanthobacteraceae bacterium]|nr:lytic transglycosylase domain-containing protein [Xanthobacteraceae bacterium]